MYHLYPCVIGKCNLYNAPLTYNDVIKRIVIEYTSVIMSYTKTIFDILYHGICRAQQVNPLATACILLYYGHSLTEAN